MNINTLWVNRSAIAALIVAFAGVSAWSSVNSNGETGVVRTLSAKTSGKAMLNIGTGISFQQDGDYLQGYDYGKGEVRDREGNVISSGLEAATLFSSNVFMGIGPLSFLDIGFSLPFYYDWAGVESVRDGGLGDLELSMKITVPSPNKIFFQGYYLAGTIPIGMKNNGLFPRHTYFEDNNVVNSARSFYSAKYPTLKGELLVTVDFKGIQANLPILVHLNLGGVFTLSQLDLHNTVITALAVEYSPLYFLDIFVDLHAESRFSNFSADVNLRNDPIYLSPGLKIKTPTGLYLTFAGDFSLSSSRMSDRLNWKPVNGGGKDAEYSTGVIPRYGVQFMFGWQGFVTVQDDDNDGINNTMDRCPKDAEDIDSFEDSDGCPDADNDHDGVIDLKDKCPNDAEDKDGFDDSDGCPDPDNDADGIEDLKDLCPNVTEDLDLFEDADGCPDLDNDKDGIVDTKDKCPNEVEDFDGFEDTDGCPELDNDKDGIIDSKDKCPNDAENFNNKEDSDGCPDTIVRVIDMPKQQLIKGVTFKNNSHEMSFESYEKFEPVIKLLKQYPEVSIEVRAHTDAVGDYAKNMQLSQMRAEAVRQYFISKAVEQERVRAVGMGSSNPLADNRTAAGRTQNRRVEILRIK